MEEALSWKRIEKGANEKSMQKISYFLLGTNVMSLKFEINKLLQVQLYMNIKADLQFLKIY